MTLEQFFEIRQKESGEAAKIANEAIRTARERKVSVPEIIKQLAEQYAIHEACTAENNAIRNAYAEGYSTGFAEGGDRL